MTIYQQVEHRIMALIDSGVLRNGEKIPSLRMLSEQLKVSVNTVREAYERLENRHYIEAIPQSGYYVRSAVPPSSKRKDLQLRELDPREVSFFQVYDAMKCAEGSAELVQLGAGLLDRQFRPEKKLAHSYQQAIQRFPAEAFDYMVAPGYRPLREQIALLGANSGQQISPDDLIITSGCQEAVCLSLMATCKPGDLVAVESPFYFNFLSLLDRLGITPVEIPGTADEGINLDVLQFVLERNPIKAVFIISNFTNPTGAVLPTAKKKRLLELLQKFDIPLIEDDIYGDLAFRGRPDTCKGYDTDGRVMLCSSFSKTISSGMRLGWTAPGRYYDEVMKLKTVINIGSPSLDQIALSIFLQQGGYERHLRRVRQGVKEMVEAARRAVQEYFPPGTIVTDPHGGSLLWVTLPSGYDTMDLYFRALTENILFAPGCLFSRKGGFTSSLRINAGSWNLRIERAIRRLGAMLAEERAAVSRGFEAAQR
jgi:DNA-binding transcriptional MocR family regulator